MKKIGILTFHRVVNDGSVLQAYCLFKYLQTKFPNAIVEIINYQPAKINKRIYRSFIAKKWPFWQHSNWRKFSSHNQFYRKYTKLSNDRIVTDDLEKANAFIKQQGYDAVFVGSDTVWDVRKDGGAPDVPNIYFLPNVGYTKKIAFAASMDKGEPETVTKKLWYEQIEYVKDFDFITVRDEATRKKLTEYGIPTADIHFMPDPTFLWDFRDIAAFPDGIKFNFDNVAGLAVADANLRSEITQQLLKQGFNVMNLLGPVDKDHIPLPNYLSFENRIALYSKLKFMVTDRFHGTILTLKQSKAPVLFIEASDYYPKPNGKGRDLFRRLGLTSMFWRWENHIAIPSNLVEEYVSKSMHIEWPVCEQMKKIEEQGNKLFSCIVQDIFTEI